MINISDLRRTVEARLEALAPTINRLADPDDDAPLDPDGRVHPYYFLTMGAPVPPDAFNESLCADPGPDRHEWRVTCVGGDRERCERAAHRVMAAHRGWWPTGTSGRVRAVPIGGTIDADRTFTPARYYLHLAYVLDAP